MNSLPRDILDRVERVLDYHQKTKQHPGAAPAKKPVSVPNPNRIFDELPKIALPTSLLDASSGTLGVLASGLEAVPDSVTLPPQDLKTLASWLYFAYGNTIKARIDGHETWLRTCPSSGWAYPCEIYVAAFAVHGLESGLYHYSPREFSLRKMRDGAATLATLKRGRPDLEFLKTVPAALLVSTVFSRSSAVHGRRGYRDALLDAGRLVQNLVATATGLGIQNLVRLRLTESTSRELIGLGPETEYADAESVQAMVVWGDAAAEPIQPAPRVLGPAALLPPIPRKKSPELVTSFGSILAAHEDCVAVGVAVREIRPPLTEVVAISEDFADHELGDAEELPAGQPLRHALMNARPVPRFGSRSISRDWMMGVNRLTFRGGSFFPMFPDGPHVGLIRPFWLIFEVRGMEQGVWYYHPQRDAWAILQSGLFRKPTRQVMAGNEACATAAAVCVLTANLRLLMQHAGPDLYRLAHLEAGIVAQRLHLAAYSSQLACVSPDHWYEDDVRWLLGIDNSPWEPLAVTAIGGVEGAGEATIRVKRDEDDTGVWRD
jgi:SagB-type dehydrogenase family enzyme